MPVVLKKSTFLIPAESKKVRILPFMVKFSSILFVRLKFYLIFAACLIYKQRVKNTKKGRETRMFN